MNIEQLMSFKVQGYRVIYNYATGFCVYLNSKLLYISHKFANQFDNEIHAHLSVMEEYFKETKLNE